MKKTLSALTAVAMSAVLAVAPVFAEDGTAESVPAATVKPAGRTDAWDSARAIREKFENVSDEEKEAAKEQYKQAMEEAREEAKKAGKSEKTEKTEKSEKAARPEMPEGVERPARPEMTDEQKAELRAGMDEKVSEIEGLVEAYKAAETDEEKAAAFEELRKAVGGGRGMNGLRGQRPEGPCEGVCPEGGPRRGMGRIELTDEQKAVFEEIRAKIAELKEKLDVAESEEEKEEILAAIEEQRAALQAEIEKLKPESVPAAKLEKAETSDAAVASVEAAVLTEAVEAAEMLEIVPSFTEIPNEAK
ncbi:MAG: hypothetical protein ACI4SS_01890 [Clostridia bacterium]